MTPTFSRSWLMKMAVVLVWLSAPVILRSAWDMSRAWRPTWLSPISPSISALGTSAATESMTTTSIAPERISMSMISSACSPVSGWETSSASVSTPSFWAYSGSSACSASMNAAMPPAFCAFARACSATVVLPLLSGPYISTIRPRGRPPMPSATSRAIDPVGITSIGYPRLIAEPHDRALAELPLDLDECGLQSLIPVTGPFRGRLAAWCHEDSLPGCS